MTTNKAIFGFLALLAACSQEGLAPAREASPISLRVAADYDAARLGRRIRVTIRNEGTAPVCFQESDVEPGYGSTALRDDHGAILNGSINPALQEWRGVNFAGPLVAIAPGKTNERFIELTEIGPQPDPLLLQLRVGAFRCGDLFGDGDGQVPRTQIDRVFRIANGRISEDSRRFSDNEPPPSPTGNEANSH